MCGIFASVSAAGYVDPSPALQACLCRRGPDHSALLQTTSRDVVVPLSLSFFSTVLSLRGGHVTAQPLLDPATGSVLCWNGEAWRVAGEGLEGNDGEVILSLLSAAAEQPSFESSIVETLDVLRRVAGPFAFVFYDKFHDLIYLGRDRLGRRSLLYNADHVCSNVQFSSLSVAPHTGWHEVEADGIYVLDLGNALSSESSRLSSINFGPFTGFRAEWWDDNVASSEAQSLGAMNSVLPTEIFLLSTSSASVLALEGQLKKSLEPRVSNIPDPSSSLRPEDTRLAVLFSGGLDCTVLARLAHDLVPLEQSIDLINVAFENPRVVQAAKKNMTLGKDINLSFYEACPDRVTGRSAFSELQRACPGRYWRFVEVNVPYVETTAHKATVISLIHPHNTEMDLSIAFALYFAARGQGISNTQESSGTEYTTTARVLLSGLGADELFGGYTRHATAFSRYGYKGLIEELELDVNRLGKRNLGRDDRVISNWGREARFPYLDEDLVQWALSVPVWEKCGFGNMEAEGTVPSDVIEPGKKVLRLLAQNLGLPTVAREKKRAIQFGARTAKMETGRTKGTTLVS